MSPKRKSVSPSTKANGRTGPPESQSPSRNRRGVPSSQRHGRRRTRRKRARSLASSRRRAAATPKDTASAGRAPRRAPPFSPIMMVGALVLRVHEADRRADNARQGAANTPRGANRRGVHVVFRTAAASVYARHPDVDLTTRVGRLRVMSAAGGALPPPAARSSSHVRRAWRNPRQRCGWTRDVGPNGGLRIAVRRHACHGFAPARRARGGAIRSGLRAVGGADRPPRGANAIVVARGFATGPARTGRTTPVLFTRPASVAPSRSSCSGRLR